MVKAIRIQRWWKAVMELRRLKRNKMALRIQCAVRKYLAKELVEELRNCSALFTDFVHQLRNTNHNYSKKKVFSILKHCLANFNTEKQYQTQLAYKFRGAYLHRQLRKASTL